MSTLRECITGKNLKEVLQITTQYNSELNREYSWVGEFLDELDSACYTGVEHLRDPDTPLYYNILDGKIYCKASGWAIMDELNKLVIKMAAKERVLKGLIKMREDIRDGKISVEDIREQASRLS